MSTTVLNVQSDDSKAVTFIAVLLIALFLRPSIFYGLSEGALVLLLAIIAGYLIVGKKGHVGGRKAAFVGLGVLFYVYEAIQAIVLGTASPIVVLREMGFLLAPALALFLISRRTWKAAVLALMAPTLIFLPSYLLSGVLTVLSGSVEPLILKRFVLDMGDATYDAAFAFPYSLYIDTPEVGPFVFGRAVGYMREPGVYQVPLIISYFATDFLDLRYKRALKGAFLVNIILTFSTAGWGAFVASWLYYNVFSSKSNDLADRSTVLRRVGALLLSIPLFYFVVYAETQVSLTQKLADSSKRLLAAIDALQTFSENPIWGVGFQNPKVSTIHFIGTAAELGIVGVILIFLLILGPIWTLVRKRHPVLVFLVPLVLTMLFAQPLFGTAFFFLVLAIVVGYPSDTPLDPTASIDAETLKGEGQS